MFVNCCSRHPIVTGKVGNAGLRITQKRLDLPNLLGIKLWLAPANTATGTRSRKTSLCALTDQVSLEFRQGSEQVDGQLSQGIGRTVFVVRYAYKKAARRQPVNVA